MDNEKKEIIQCSVSNSITSIMSTMTAFVKKLICSYFPDEYFKDIYITTSVTSNEQVKEDMPIKQTPLLSITPKFNQNFDDTASGAWPMWRRGFYQGYRARHDRKYGYKIIFENDIDDVFISAIPNRIKFTFDLKIKLDSHMKKINVCHMLRQKFHDNDRWFYNNVQIETVIPNVITTALAAIKGYNLEDNDELIEYNKYLSSYGMGQIRPVIYTGNGLTSYMYSYLANILVAVASPPETDGGNVERTNMAEAKPVVEFTLDTEMWVPNNYMFECGHLPKGDYNKGLEDQDKIIITSIYPVLPPKVKGDFTRINYSKFITDVNIKLDSIDIHTLFTKNVLKFIKKCVKKKDFELLDGMFAIDVYRDSKLLKTDIKINWETLNIEILYPRYNYVYHIAIYARQDLLNKYIIEESKDIT